VVSILEVMILVVGLESLQVVSLLGILPLALNTGMGGVVDLRWRGGTAHGLPFVVLVLPSLERVGGVCVGSFDRRNGLDCANPTLEQMAQHWFYSFGTNPVLSRLFAHVLVFEFQVGDLKNISLIDSGCSRHMTGDKGGSQVSSRW
jgi:hypothetical protein